MAGEENETELRVSSSRSHSIAVASDASFRSSVGSSPSAAFSLVSDVESEFGDGSYPWTQCEYEEIPSFRWIASPLRWWKTKKKRDLSRRSSAARAASRGEEPGPDSSTEEVDSGRERSQELVHLDGDEEYRLEDLLRASAELLGKGSYGTSYMAGLEDGTQVTVKRLKGEAAPEFEAEVTLLGRIRHPNIVPLKAYYYSRDEKLLVFDYMPRGNLSAFLRSHADDPYTRLNWLTRISIAIGMARGVQHLHINNNIVHGNLTSKNVLLDDHDHPKIADYGLPNLFTAATNSNAMAIPRALGYHAPELSELWEANTKTDVYSLGMILLELLTGVSPAGMGLPRWIVSIREEDWIERVLDQDLRLEAMETTEFKVLSFLKLALQCVDSSPDARPEVQQLLQRLEEIKSEVLDAEASMDVAAPTTDEDTSSSSFSLDLAEERRAPPSEVAMLRISEASDILPEDRNTMESAIPFPSVSPASIAEAMTTPKSSSSESNLREGEFPTPTQVEDSAHGLAEDDQLQTPSLGDSPARLVCPLSSIDWGEVNIDVQLQVPTSPPLVSSGPDLIYQRYFQTLYDLAHRSPPLPSNLLEVQLNKMIMGLQSLGYPIEQWLEVATLVLVFAKKQEYIKQHVDGYKLSVEAQLKECSSAIAPLEEQISRIQSDITGFEQKQETLDETIAKLEGQLALLKVQHKDVVDSLTTARDELTVVEEKRESVLFGMGHLNQQYCAISNLQETMLHELLPSLDEAFDSSFQEIVSKKF